MASLSYCSSFPTTLSHKQIPPSLSLSKTNPCPLPLYHSFSSLSLASRPLSASALVPKSSQTEPSVVESVPEPETVDVQPSSEAAETSVEEAKREEIFAVVMIGSRQYIVFPGRFLYTQRLKGASVNDKIILNKVLLVGTKTSTYIGKPIVPNAAVHAVVEEQGLDPKVVVFKYKKKKNYRRNIGHRQMLSCVSVRGADAAAAAARSSCPWCSSVRTRESNRIEVSLAEHLVLVLEKIWVYVGMMITVTVEEKTYFMFPSLATESGTSDLKDW
ncbi:hypothetical protein RJ640_003407 [Escallonia rubra]|uniref:50S ribosomal protein L21, chloroplastic n=1 Tax=Escallonia rubra TaxID=112253 RepID=A0AA88UJZ2_9ASTE|nr:hypothetical protein RJ640_003407 [Escallonia rubra]